MAYPYTHKNRAQGCDQIELHKLGPDGGGGVTFTAVLTTTGVLSTINLPYNAWQLGGSFWATDNSAALTIQVRPWIDHGQTVLGEPTALTQIGSASVVTSISIAAQTLTDGVAFEVLSGTGSLAALIPTHNIFVHGVQVSVTAATALTSGTYDWEIVCVPEA